MKIYLIMGIIKKQKISIGSSEENKITQDINLTWADGMMGVLPVFNNKEDAEKYAGDKYGIEERIIP